MKISLKITTAQTALEFIVLFVILVGAFLAMQKYIKRGIQGKWKANMESIGEQYDPLGTKHIVETMSTNSMTIMEAVEDLATGNLVTMRTDTSNTQETKTGTTTIQD